MSITVPAASARAPETLTASLWRGFRSRCPACGEGRLFASFLKVSANCPACGEALHHHRADDFPAYLVIVLVGHIVVPLVLWVELHFGLSTLAHIALWVPTTLGLALGLLGPIKGAVVALQWHQGMHGFAEARKARLAAT